jgi:hypothetical protein
VLLVVGNIGTNPLLELFTNEYVLLLKALAGNLYHPIEPLLLVNTQSLSYWSIVPSFASNLGTKPSLVEVTTG